MSRPVRFVHRYAIHARTYGQPRIIYAYTEEARESIEKALDQDPDSIRVKTVPENTQMQVIEKPKQSAFMDVLVAVGVVVALLFGIGVL